MQYIWERHYDSQYMNVLNDVVDMSQKHEICILPYNYFDLNFTKL